MLKFQTLALFLSLTFPHFTATLQDILLDDPNPNPDKIITRGPLLGFVTPWNNVGYKHSIDHAMSLDYVSPTWLEIIYASSYKSFYIKNIADIEQGAYVIKLKKNNPNIKIVPRLIIQLQEMNSSQLINLLMNPDFVIDQLATHLSKYDGVVLDMGTLFHQQLMDKVLHFMHTIGFRLREEENKETLVTFFNPKKESAELEFTNLRNFIEKSKDIFTHFILMSYDFNLNNEFAPLWWAENALNELLTSKQLRYEPPPPTQIMLGIPFYGMDYGLKQIGPYTVPHRLGKMKSENVKLQWNEKSQEHYYQEDSKLCIVPSAQFFIRRRELAEKFEVGISVWELGQGFGDWIDLL